MGDCITVPFDAMEVGSGSVSPIGHVSLKLLCAEINEPDCHLPEESAGEPLQSGRMESLIDRVVTCIKQPGEPGQDVKSIRPSIYR